MVLQGFRRGTSLDMGPWLAALRALEQRSPSVDSSRHSLISVIFKFR
jgi:hypothetical protein